MRGCGAAKDPALLEVSLLAHLSFFDTAVLSEVLVLLGWGEPHRVQSTGDQLNLCLIHSSPDAFFVCFCFHFFKIIYFYFMCTDVVLTVCMSV